MRVDQIKRLIELVEQSDIDELEVSEWGRSIRIARRSNPAGRVVETARSRETDAPVTMDPGSERQSASPASAPESVKKNEVFEPILSPMVGTYYGAASPTEAPFVEVGGRVVKGQTVCIIEAMKLMNEIEAEISGTIVKSLLENEEPVEFNQPLFLVRPD